MSDKVTAAIAEREKAKAKKAKANVEKELAKAKTLSVTVNVVPSVTFGQTTPEMIAYVIGQGGREKFLA